MATAGHALERPHAKTTRAGVGGRNPRCPAKPPARPGTGRALAERIVAGDERAFGELHARYRTRVNAFALRRVSNPADAEDITQEVFLQIHRSLQSFQGRSNLSTWIFGIAHNVVCRHYRKQHGARVPLEGAEVDARLSYLPRTEGRIDASRAIEHCDQALARSRPAEHQRIFELFYGNGKPMRVIAEMCGRPTESVKDSLRRSRDLLLRDVPELRQALQAARDERSGATPPPSRAVFDEVA